jgi:hypothetical protein
MTSAPTIGSTIAYLRRMNELEMANIVADLAYPNARRQATCKHKWRWYQTAGEGRVCEECGQRCFCSVCSPD